MIGKKLCYLFNQSESLFPRSSFATHDPQFALSFACTLCAVNLGYTVCCTVFCTRFCYPQKTIFQSQGSGIWAQNSKAAPRLSSPLPTPSVQTLIPALLILLELVYIYERILFRRRCDDTKFRQVSLVYDCGGVLLVEWLFPLLFP